MEGLHRGPGPSYQLILREKERQDYSTGVHSSHPAVNTSRVDVEKILNPGRISWHWDARTALECLIPSSGTETKQLSQTVKTRLIFQTIVPGSWK